MQAPGQVLDHAQVEIKLPAFMVSGRQIELLAIGRRAGVIADARLAALGPIGQGLEVDVFRAAPFRVEAHVPRPGQMEHLARDGKVQLGRRAPPAGPKVRLRRARRLLGTRLRVPEDDENALPRR